MNNNALTTLHKLFALYPKALFGDPRQVRPLAPGVREELLRRHSKAFGEINLKNCISIYRTTRHYFQAVAARQPAVKLDGSTAAALSDEEVAKAQDWATRWTISHCCDAARSSALDKVEHTRIIHILENDHYELRVLSALAARNSSRQSDAFELRRQMLGVTEALAAADPRPERYRTVEYTRYYYAVSGCSLAQLNGDFKTASDFAAMAGKAAKQFRGSPRFFPNFFADQTDIETRDVYLSAVAAFRDGQFESAGQHFERWLTLNGHRLAQGNATYDSNLFHKYICFALDALHRNQASAVDWNELESFLRNPNLNIYRTTRALWDHIEPLKSLSLRYSADAGIKSIVLDLLRKTQDEWQLLFTGAPLAPGDRSAGLEEPVRLPQFLDVTHLVNDLSDSWRYLLQQSLRNALILKSDYEVRLAKVNKATSSAPPSLKESYEIEGMSDKDLLAYTKSLIAGRSFRDVHIFEKCEPLWFEALTEANRGDKATALAKYDRFFEVLRSVPHILQIISVKAGPSIGPLVDHRKLVRARRVWRYPQDELSIECDTGVSVGGHAYMRPRWNRSLKTHFRIKEGTFEPILESRVPQWMGLFEKWASGAGAVPASQFLRWCEQVDPQRRSIPLRLLTRFVYFSEDEARDLWKHMYRNLVPADFKGSRTVYTGVGYSAKSGSHQLYTVKQALVELPESERDFDFEEAFRTLDSLRKEDAEIDSIAFVDDFIGSGEQAIKFFERLRETHPWVMSRRIVMCALAGFESGAVNIQNYLRESSARVLLGKTLKEKDRAFSPDNTLWDSEADRLDAKSWTAKIGRALLSSTDVDPEGSALGWKGSQALIAFHHNIPNNTLPLFWAGGKVGGKEWFPLFDRF